MHICIRTPDHDPEMACCLLCDKPLPETMLTRYKLDLRKQTSVKFESK